MKSMFYCGPLSSGRECLEMVGINSMRFHLMSDIVKCTSKNYIYIKIHTRTQNRNLKIIILGNGAVS